MGTRGHMGYYLNSNKVGSLYESEARKPYFIDKSEMLVDLMTLVEREDIMVMSRSLVSDTDQGTRLIKMTIIPFAHIF